ncbi:MAG: dihydropyrimidinase [Candidatus Velamenicoccus archaeovorus]
MLLVRGGTIVDATGTAAGDVLIDGERIAAVGEGLDPTGHQVIDAAGALVVPGAIDPHTHFDLPVGTTVSADDFGSGTLAAACGGTTCVVDFAGAGREPPDEALRVWHAKAEGRAVIDYGFHLTVTAVPEDPAEAEGLFRWFALQGVTSVKLYLAYPERLMVDPATLERALVAAKRIGVLVCVHAEDGSDADRRTRQLLAAGRTDPSALALARPPEVEAAAVRLASGLAERATAPLYVVHLSSAAGLAEVRAARQRHVRVLAETCPQYLYLTDRSLRTSGVSGPTQEAADFVCTPPPRTDADREALWAGLADRDLDVVATDHCPFTRDARRRGTKAGGAHWRDFTEIPGGLPGVETRLSLVYQGVREGRFGPERWVELVSSAPARLFGLSRRKGRLAPGMDADVVVFDPTATKRLTAGDLHMRTDHSPYADLTVTGWPAVTIVRGRVVARGGEPADAEPGWGRFVPRERTG